MRKHIFLIRHAEPEEAYTKRFLGRLNPGLSLRGEEQARRAAVRVKELAPQIILSSPLLRAQQTASFIADACNVQLQIEPLLLEVDFGELEGLTFKEASEKFAGITDSWQALAGDFCFPGGERFQDFNQRCRDMAAQLCSRPEERIALVAHGGVLRGILCNLLAVEANGPLRFRFSYASLTTLELYADGSAVLTGFNIGRSDPPPVPSRENGSGK